MFYFEGVVSTSTTSGACRRLGIRYCVRPHDDADKGTKFLFKKHKHNYKTVKPIADDW